MLSKLVVFCTFASMLAGHAFGGSCDTLNCQTVGSACGTTSGNVKSYCQGDATCVTSSPGSSTSVCVLASTVKGRTCATDNDCSGGSSVGTISQLTYPLCSGAVCRTALGYANDICSVAADCTTSICTNGKCVANKDIGASCTKTSECPAQSICLTTGSTSVCTALVDTGSGCAASSSLCKGANVCFNSVCTKRYSVAAAGSCSNGGNKMKSVCGYELTCDSSSKTCVQSTTTNLFANCTSDSDCGNGNCNCNNKVGQEQCYSDVNKCTDEYSGYVNCLANSNCHVSSSISNENSCAYRSCGDAYLTYVGCLLRDSSKSYTSECLAGVRSPASVVESSLLTFF